MFHRPYRIIGGHKVLSSESTWAYKLTQKIMKERAYKYLTQDERVSYEMGADVYIIGDEWMKRVKGK
jgi:hypothetical protein